MYVTCDIRSSLWNLNYLLLFELQLRMYVHIDERVHEYVNVCKYVRMRSMCVCACVRIRVRLMTYVFHTFCGLIYTRRLVTRVFKRVDICVDSRVTHMCPYTHAHTHGIRIDTNLSYTFVCMCDLECFPTSPFRKFVSNLICRLFFVFSRVSPFFLCK